MKYVELFGAGSAAKADSTEILDATVEKLCQQLRVYN
jgi:hypothetical protein